MILCAGNNETFPFATSIGVGLIQSSINFTKLCLTNKPDSVTFIGSAGSYGNHDIFDIVQSSSASNIELSFLSDDSYTPLNNIIENINIQTEVTTIVNSSNYITTNMKLAKKFTKFNISIENMEFFSLCTVAQEFNIPISGIFVITNYTNKDAHKDFIKNHKIALDHLIKHISKKNIIKS